MSSEISLRSHFAGHFASGLERTFLDSVAWAMKDGAKIEDAEALAAQNVARLSWLVADAMLKQAQSPSPMPATPVYWLSK